MTDSTTITLRPRIGVVIPVYRDVAGVCWCLGRFAPTAVDSLCLIVDLPLESEIDQIREASRTSQIPIHIIKNPARTGVGKSLRQGFTYLAATGHEIVVVMAGNGKDDPCEVSRLTEPILTGAFDYVQGSRYLPQGKALRTPLTRMIFNRLYPAIWTIATGVQCTDVTNGFRAIRMSVLQDARVNLNQTWLDGYSLEYYLYYKVHALGYRMKEVPVSKTYAFRGRGGYSRINPLKDWWSIISPLLLLLAGVRE